MKGGSEQQISTLQPLTHLTGGAYAQEAST